MPLEFKDFAHHYEGSEMTETQQRENFEALANIMECITRLFWQEGSHEEMDAFDKAIHELLEQTRMESATGAHGEGVEPSETSKPIKD